jgi:sulfur relay (sulfurtransferase) DsrC/TusE family protein
MTRLGRRPGNRAQDVLAYMREFFVANDQLPPARMVADKFGWASENAAYTHISSLVKTGHLERNEAGKYRFTRRQT